MHHSPTTPRERELEAKGEKLLKLLADADVDDPSDDCGSGLRRAVAPSIIDAHRAADALLDPHEVEGIEED